MTPRGATTLLCAVLVAARATAQDTNERIVTVHVASASERSVYFDQGREAGLAPGTFVRLFPPGAGTLEVEVRAVTQTSARADLPPGVPVPPVGTRGEARVASAPSATRREAPPRATPAHPPWTRNEPPRAPDQPLLVPTFRQRPDERPATWRGRAFGSLLYSEYGADDGSGSNDYLFARLGTRIDATNVIGHGEHWLGAGELDVRSADVSSGGDADDVDDTRGRLDLLSVRFGTEAWAPTGVELGRFWSRYLPEIGLVDGIEVVRRFQDGVQLGGGLGAYPRPFPARDTGDDVGVHLFADWTADAERSLAATVGVQKTWHRGDADRDLVVLRAEWRPTARTALSGTAKLDVYRGDDRIKGSGVELTEALVQARWSGDQLGTGITASHFTWPELLRAEYVMLPVELVRDGEVQRVSWYGSWRVTGPVTLRASADGWRDQDRDGTTFGGDLDWRGCWRDTTALTISAFVNDGGYTTGPGTRVTLRDRVGDGDVRAAFRWYRYDLQGLVSGPEQWTRQSFELGIAWPLGDGGDLDCTLERWFGDRDDATSLGLYLQWRF